MTKPKPLDDQALLHKHVAAIHVDGKLTLLQRKAINVLLLNAYDSLLTQPVHRIEVRALSLLSGFDSNDTRQLKQALKALASTPIEWDILNPDGSATWATSAIIAHAKLHKGVCEYAYSPELARRLYHPDTYATINLNIQRKFSSGHTLALYENCVRFRKARSTGWWDIDTFRRLMGVAQFPLYEKFKYLNDRVIRPSVEEINATSDIIIETEFAKNGRHTASLRFLVRDNPQLSLIDEMQTDAIRTSQAFAKAKQFGISDRLAYQWILDKGEDYVLAKIAYTEQQEKQGRIRGTSSGFLIAAVEGDYRTPDERDHNTRSRRAGKQRAGASAEAAARAETETQVEERRRCREIVRILAAELSAAEDTRLRTECARLLSSDFARAEFDRDGWESFSAAPVIIRFWKERAPHPFASGDTS